MIIDVSIKNKIATLVDPNAYGVCHNGDYIVRFDFDSEWDEFATKTMRVNYNEYSTSVIFSGNECALPIIGQPSSVEIGVFAGDLHTSTPATIPFIKSVTSATGPEPDPTPDVYAQIIKMLEELSVGTSMTKDGTVVSPNADFAEVAEWADGNPNNEDRTGYFVCADVPVHGIVMKKAKSTDAVKGVTIKNPAFAGNYTEDKLDSEGNLLPKYSFVAVIGFVPVIDNGRCTVGGRCMPDDNGCAIPSSNSMGYQVVNRIDENRVLIIIEPNGDMVQRIKTKVNQMQEQIDKAAEVVSTKAGKKTVDGGEIFNDYENNQSISEFSSAKGSYTFAGTKFFYIIDKNEVNKTYTLKDYYLDISSSGELAVNDLFSITTGGNREDCGTIESITQEEGTNNAIVTVSNWYWDTSSEPDPEKPSSSFIFRVIDKPLCGTDIMGAGASSEGYSTKALMMGCHSEGYFTIAGGKYSHAEGRETRAGYSAHAEGWGTKAMGQEAHSEGHFTNASGFYSHSEGNTTESSGICSHSEGNGTKSQGKYSHSEGTNTKATGEGSHSEGRDTTASGVGAHAEGSYSSDENDNRIYTEATGTGSHAEGLGTKATGYASHSEGRFTKASNSHAHAEGYKCEAQGSVSHAEGTETIAKGSESHAEGKNTLAKGSTSHAEGEDTTASGYSSHAEGRNTVAGGAYSHAGGLGTIASGSSQTSIGKYNREDVNALLIVGNGSGPSATERSNAFTVNRNGTATIQTNPIEDMDVATKNYVDTAIGDIEAAFDELHTYAQALVNGGNV